MPIVLVKEDGSIPVGANTYVSADELVTFGAMRGVTVVADDTAAVALVQAMDLISSYAERFVGERCSALQALDWPRRRYIDEAAPGEPPRGGINALGAPLPYVMPAALTKAQCFAALAALSGTDLQPIVGTEGFLSVDKTGPLSQTFVRGTDYSNQPRIPAFTAAILTLCEQTAYLSVYRG